MTEYVKIYEDDNFFLRDDVASGIILEDGENRYSLFYKPYYHRVIVYCGTEEYALTALKSDYDILLEEAINFSK